jgi:G2/mitotic-specific cyclin 3/4
MIAAGGLKVAAKRTAFGDVGNTNRMASSKDDSALPGKTNFSDLNKSAKPLQERKSAALLRPAQRPLSLPGLKGPIGSQASAAMQSINENGETSQPQQKKTVIKRKTTVFKDEVSIAPVAVDTAAPPQEGSSAFALAPVHQNLPPRHHKSQPHLKDEKPVLRKTKSRFIKEQPVDEKQVNLLTLSSDAPDARSDGVELSERAPIALPPPEIAAPSAFVSQPKEAVSSPPAENKDIQQLILEQDRILAATAAEYVESTAPKPVSEPEECWEDEDNDIIYDDEGYTTARSYRSRDNTTGGPTIVLFPKVTAKTRREIAGAKQWVESIRTEDDAEDEYWDITMVSEYSEEIFAYMKELEVRRLQAPPRDTVLTLLDQNASQP